MLDSTIQCELCELTQGFLLISQQKIKIDQRSSPSLSQAREQTTTSLLLHLVRFVLYYATHRHIKQKHTTAHIFFVRDTADKKTTNQDAHNKHAPAGNICSTEKQHSTFIRPTLAKEIQQQATFVQPRNSTQRPPTTY